MEDNLGKNSFAKIYQIAYQDLLEIAERSDLKEKNLEIYFQPNHILINYEKWGLVFEGEDDIQYFMCRLAESLQNSGPMGNIKFDKAHIDLFNECLYGFNPKEIEKQYKDEDSWKTLLEVFKGKSDKEGKAIVGIRKDGKVSYNWEKFCKGVIDGARYLAKYGSGIAYRLHVTSKKHEIIDEIKDEVFGMGLTLASDFIKEIGYTDFGKPDVHIEDVYKTIFPNEPVTNDLVMKFLQNISDSLEGNITTYQVDKVLWLVCAKPGKRFYMDDVHETNKEILLAKYTKSIK